MTSALRSLLISGTTKNGEPSTDTYQAIPLYGYTGCSRTCCLTGTSRSCSTLITEIVGIIPYREMIYTGPIDEFFDYRYGKLPYRSVEFKHETLNTPVHQPVAVVNYPNEHLYTRVTEFKYLTGQEHLKLASSTSTHESGDPYYPVPRSENAELYKKNKRWLTRPGAFRRVAGNIQVLQHGPSSSDPNALHQACGTRQYWQPQENGHMSRSLVRRFTEQRSRTFELTAQS